MEFHLRSPVERIVIEGWNRARGDRAAKSCGRITTSARCPLNACRSRAGLDLDISAFEHSPITGIHLWFDRPVTDVPQATLLDRTIQWMFNKPEGRYVQLVVSASRSLLEMPRADVIALAIRELEEFFPRRGREARKAHVVKEFARPSPPARAGIAAAESHPSSATCSWPETGPVRDGRRSWKARCAAGTSRPRPSLARRECRAEFLLPDIA